MHVLTEEAGGGGLHLHVLLVLELILVQKGEQKTGGVREATSGLLREYQGAGATRHCGRHGTKWLRGAMTQRRRSEDPNAREGSWPALPQALALGGPHTPSRRGMRERGSLAAQGCVEQPSYPDNTAAEETEDHNIPSLKQQGGLSQNPPSPRPKLGGDGWQGTGGPCHYSDLTDRHKHRGI